VPPISSFGFYDNPALLTPVPDLFRACCFDLLKIIAFSAMFLEALGAVPVIQFIGVDGQMTVPTSQHIFLFRQQNEGEMPA
jgi:hypothetical protein